MKKKQWIALIAVAIIVAGGLFIVSTVRKLTVTIPEYQQPGELVLVGQGWSDADRLRFHHTAQGTRLIPYAWFMALEQPCFSLTGCAAFADSKYLGRFGFLDSKTDPELNPAGLPIGFALQKDFHDPLNKQTYPVIGLTCAACHTGALRYGKYTVQIEGGPAMIEVTEFQKAVGVSLALTEIYPFRYGRFEKHILGPNATEDQKKALNDSFAAFMKGAKAEKKAVEERNIYGIGAGFARTDALTRIGNQVFAVDMKNDANFAPSKAPVRFPQIWNASWFNWVQYNSSISDPLVRNIGEALGVRAVAKLYGDDAAEFNNSVHVEGLKTVEDLLAGPAPFQGLASPKWPSVFPPIDTKKAALGGQIYKQRCQGCHLPPVPELLADLSSKQPAYWWKNGQGKSFLVVHDVKVNFVGTDPHEAIDFMERTADTGDLKKGRVGAAAGLDLITKGIGENFFQKAGFSPEKRIAWSGFRDPKDPAVRAEPIYKARPLNGIWAVAPYLHNGSVPTIYDLLSPASERPAQFWLGSKQFDPVKVGYETSKLEGGYQYDVKSTGNSNSGHEFKDGPLGKGTIGPALSPDERWAVVEYLKSLEEPARATTTI
jgi:hypothetical protein